MRFKLEEMTYNKDKAIERIRHETETYSGHLIKRIIYKNSTNNLWHWCDELADKIDTVSRIKLKSGGKFPQKFYEDEFFLADGDYPSDFEITLKISRGILGLNIPILKLHLNWWIMSPKLLMKYLFTSLILSVEKIIMINYGSEMLFWIILKIRLR